MKQVYTALLALSFALQSQAQTKDTKQWSLEECIHYAIENNINIKQQEQDQENKERDLHTAKHDWLPDLNGGIGQNFDFGRSPSKTGVIVDQNSANTSASLQLSMPLFDGLKTPNNISASKLNLKAATERLAKAKEDLSIQVASFFVQVLYNKELLTVAQLQRDLTERQVEKTKAMVDAGKLPLSQLYDIKAQLAKDESSLTEATNNLDLAKLDLAQSLELERSEGNFDIKVPVVDNVIETYMSSIVPPDDIYNRAVEVKPQIREQAYLLESQKKMLKVAKSAWYPKLSLSASYSNGYYHFYQDGFENIAFRDQLKQNQRKTIGFVLQIPIFNKFRTRNNVRSARTAIRTRELMMDNAKKVLYKEIQQAFFNATAAQASFRSSEKSVLANKEAFSYAENRYAAGKSTVFEFNDAKTKYAQSLAQQAQAKYNYIFRAKILDFYNGVPITL